MAVHSTRVIGSIAAAARSCGPFALRPVHTRFICGQSVHTSSQTASSPPLRNSAYPALPGDSLTNNGWDAHEPVDLKGISVSLPPELLPGAGRGIKVVVGVSGGVDSSVSALLLKRAGYDVHGVFMKNWDSRDEGGSGAVCTADEDILSARRTCETLDIPFSDVNFVKDYWLGVFEEFLRDYAEGITPNPDVLCNREIKFSKFFDHAVGRLGAHYVATGHYARVRRRTSMGTVHAGSDAQTVQLVKSRDLRKDQTLFLCWVPASALARTIFPIGHLEKTTVKEIAHRSGLSHSAQRRESMGICFVGKRSFSDFISDFIPDNPGDVVTIDGRVVGKHRGLHHMTIGQRARISGLATAALVAWKDVAGNRVVVVDGSTHPLLYSRALVTLPGHWMAGVHPLRSSFQQQMSGAAANSDTGGEILQSARLDMRFRHQTPLIPCRVSQREDAGHDGLLVRADGFENTAFMKMVTPGQVAVFYDGDVCLGGASIECAAEVGHGGSVRLWNDVVRSAMSESGPMREAATSLKVLKKDASARKHTQNI